MLFFFPSFVSVTHCRKSFYCIYVLYTQVQAMLSTFDYDIVQIVHSCDQTDVPSMPEDEEYAELVSEFSKWDERADFTVHLFALQCWIHRPPTKADGKPNLMQNRKFTTLFQLLFNNVRSDTLCIAKCALTSVLLLIGLHDVRHCELRDTTRTDDSSSFVAVRCVPFPFLKSLAYCVCLSVVVQPWPQSGYGVTKDPTKPFQSASLWVQAVKGGGGGGRSSTHGTLITLWTQLRAPYCCRRR